MNALELGLVLSISSAVAMSAAGIEPVAGRMRITPAVIQKGFFYNGAVVKVEGSIGNGATAIVTVTGSDIEERFNRKRRVAGVWVNASKVRVFGAPSLFLAFSSGPVRNLVDPHAVETRTLDRLAVVRQICIEPHAPSDLETLQNQFLAFKRDSGSYLFSESGIVIGAPSENGKPFSLTFEWPRAAASSNYEVHVYEVEGGVISREVEMPLQVRRVGFPEWIALLATRQPALYGIAAVLIAAFAGLGIDYLGTTLFGTKRVAHG